MKIRFFTDGTLIRLFFVGQIKNMLSNTFKDRFQNFSCTEFFVIHPFKGFDAGSLLLRPFKLSNNSSRNSIKSAVSADSGERAFESLVSKIRKLQML